MNFNNAMNARHAQNARNARKTLNARNAFNARIALNAKTQKRFKSGTVFLYLKLKIRDYGSALTRRFPYMNYIDR